MSSCPKCGHTIEADFGMFNCSSCQAFLSVDLDGNVALAEDLNESPLYSADLNSTNSEEPPSNASYEAFDSFTSDESSASPSEAESLEDINLSSPLSEDVPQDTQTTASDEVDRSSYALNEIAEDEDAQTKVLESADLSDVVDFGNSQLSSSQSGGILYDIYLSGIDTAEIREEVRLNIGDKKFLWNVEGLMKSIKNGRLVIQRVNAVKAALFIQRIKHLDIDIQWKQNEIVRLSTSE